MYKVYFINFLYYSQDTGTTLDEALEIGKQAGFEFRVEYEGEMVAFWSPIGGTRYYNPIAPQPEMVECSECGDLCEAEETIGGMCSGCAASYAYSNAY